MEFRQSQAIYLQIADYVCEKILLEEWKVNEKIPSVRELAMILEVNPNTVMRTFEFLQQQDIIFNQRGIGYYVATNAVKNVRLYRKSEFFDKELPVIFRSMYLLNIDMEELRSNFEKFKKLHFTGA